MVKVMSDLISVIVPIYQVKEYLHKCITSIINQKYKNLQIILVDDGSTDGSETICDEYAKIDKRITVIHRDNGGLVRARKTGLEYAKGDYVGFVDGDDYIDEEMYAYLYEEIIKGKADMVHTPFFFEQDGLTRSSGVINQKTIHIHDTNEKIELWNNILLDKKYGYDVFPSIWSKLFRADFIKRNYSIVPDEQSYGEDVICLYVCLSNCRVIRLAEEAHYHYVVRENSMTRIDGYELLEKELGLSNTLISMRGFLCETDKILNIAVRERIFTALTEIACDQTCFNSIHYYFSNIEMFQGKRVALYGAGRVGVGYYIQLKNTRNCEIVGVFDKRSDGLMVLGNRVAPPEHLLTKKFDYVLIAIREEYKADMIRNDLIEKGIAKDKIIWRHPLI